MKLQIEYVPKEQLKPYANNAKLHPAEQVEQIKNSIEKFDFNDPIAVWKDNIVIEGHGRLLAAMEMDDIKEVPVIRLDHLSDKERKAYTIAHNKLTMNTNFEQALLAEELKDVLDEIDMTDLGFQDYELDLGSEYIDDFFDRGVEAKEKPVVFGVKVYTETSQQLEELKNLLKEAGYAPEEL